MTASIRRHDRSVVLLAVFLIIASMLAYTAARPAGVLAEHSEGFGPIDHFTVDVTGPATAGQAFSVTVTAFDHDNAIIRDYPGGATFDDTLGASTIGCAGPCDAAYEALIFTDGEATADVTPYLAETGVTLDVSDGAATGSSDTFDVLPGPATTLDVEPDTASIVAGTTQAYTATGADAYGNDLGDVTGDTDFDVDGDSCTDADCGSTVADGHSVTGTNGSATDSVSLTVTPAALDSIELSPSSSSLTADDVPETYTAEGFDAYDNSRGDVTVETTFGISPSGTCLLNACGSATVGTYTVTGTSTTNGSISDTSDLFVTPGALDHFTFGSVGPQVAGMGFGVTITAYDAHDNVKTNYAGGAVLSGLADSPGCSGCEPSISAGYGTLSWTNGVGTVSDVIAKNAQTGAKLTATDGTEWNDSAPFTVTHSAVLGGITVHGNLANDPIGTQVAGTAFSVIVRAFDKFGNIKKDQTGGSLTGLATSPGCGACAPVLPDANPDHGTLVWSNGVATASVTAVKAQTGASISTTGLTESNSASFDVTHSATLGGVTIDTTLAWSGGVATATVTAVKAQTGASISTSGLSKSNTSNTFTVGHSGTLSGFTIDTVIGTQTAGAPFDVTVRAYDLYGNAKLNNVVGTLSNLATSPGCPNPTCAPALPATVATYGSVAWSGGTGTFTGVRAYNAQAGATIKIDAGPVGNTSNAFTVRGAAANRLFFSYAPMSFDGRPIDTKISQPIYHTCIPAAPASANPCGAGSAPVTVLAIDAYGNRAGATSIDVKVTPTSTAVTMATNTTTPGVAPYGEAAFGSALVATSTAQALALAATASGAWPASAALMAVTDLEACDGTICDNNGNNVGGSNKLQKAASRINTGSDFFVPGSTNVLLSTRFSPGSETNQSACGSAGTIGDSTEVLIDGTGVGGTSPASAIVLVMPKDTLKFYNITSRGTTSFDVCLGALKIDPASGVNVWKGKKAGAKKLQLVNSSLVDGRQWGIPADCGTPGLSAADPCIGLRTKQAAAARTYLTSIGWTTAQINAIGLQDADLTVIVRKGSPWDGKMGLK